MSNATIDSWVVLKCDELIGLGDLMANIVRSTLHAQRGGVSIHCVEQRSILNHSIVLMARNHVRGLAFKKLRTQQNGSMVVASQVARILQLMAPSSGVTACMQITLKMHGFLHDIRRFVCDGNVRQH